MVCLQLSKVTLRVQGSAFSRSTIVEAPSPALIIAKDPEILVHARFQLRYARVDSGNEMFRLHHQVQHRDVRSHILDSQLGLQLSTWGHPQTWKAHVPEQGRIDASRHR